MTDKEFLNLANKIYNAIDATLFAGTLPKCTIGIVEENRILCEIFNCSPEVLTPKYADHAPKTSAYTEERPNEA